jgi:putative drug exporter of the RND superfamily
VIRRLAERTRQVPGAVAAQWRAFREADSPWDWVADVVTTHPGKVLLTTTLLLALPIVAVPTLDLDHDVLNQLPSDAESVRGADALAEHIPPGELEPIVVVLDHDEVEIWEPEVFHALGVMSENLKLLEGVSSVRSAAMPTDGEDPEGETDEEFQELEEGIAEAAAGAREIEGGVLELRDGLVEIERQLPELVEGLREARDGAGELSAGAQEAVQGVRELRSGVGELLAGVNEAEAGLRELRSGLAEARDGARELRDEVAAPAERSVRKGYAALVAMTVGRLDPMYREAREELGETYALLTGEYPPGHPRAGQQVEEDYEGLTAALDELAEGLDEAVDGVDELIAGMGEFRDGLGQLDAGLAELQQGMREMSAGADELAAGLGEAVDGVEQLQAGIQEMRIGVEDELLPGVRELAVGLEEGHADIRETDMEALIGLEGPGPFIITPAMLENDPELREDLSFFVADDGTRTRVFIGTEEASYSDEAMATVDQIVAIAEHSLNGTPFGDARVMPTGPTAFLAEMDDIASSDYRMIIATVVAGIFIVLALLLRSLVAPFYMVLSVLFSFLVALGLGVTVFQHILGHPGLSWYLPPFLFVLLVALGIDYSIFLMSRVREESLRRSTTEGVAYGIRLTGHVITSAGLILAGTFGALIVAPLTPLAQLGFTVSIGVLLDTFVVRSFLVPSIAVLLGRWNWWPSSRASREAEAEAAGVPLDDGRGRRGPLRGPEGGPAPSPVQPR